MGVSSGFSARENDCRMERCGPNMLVGRRSKTAGPPGGSPSADEERGHYQCDGSQKLYQDVERGTAVSLKGSPTVSPTRSGMAVGLLASTLPSASSR